VPPVLDLAVNLRIDGSATTEMACIQSCLPVLPTPMSCPAPNATGALKAVALAARCSSQAGKRELTLTP
jgi:hypothetical protein